MKSLVAVAFVLAASSAGAQVSMPDYPSCNLPAQHALKGTTDGSVKKAPEAHITARANILEADLGTARKARRLTQAQADGLFKRVQAVRRGTQGFVKKQGFLSAAERASYDRDLDDVAMRLCRP